MWELIMHAFCRPPFGTARYTPGAEQQGAEKKRFAELVGRSLQGTSPALQSQPT